MSFQTLMIIRQRTLDWRPSKMMRQATTFPVQYFTSGREKTGDFYDQYANGNPRCYFYTIDMRGRLFLESVKSKNMSTSIKDPIFLDFFFKRIRRLQPKNLPDQICQDPVLLRYPYVSVCGKEYNFIRPQATPIVFHSLKRREGGPSKLVFAGSLQQDFSYTNLRISSETGWFYHTLEASSKKELPSVGLVCSSLAVSFSSRMESIESAEQSDWAIRNDKNDLVIIPCLSSEEEVSMDTDRELIDSE